MVKVGILMGSDSDLPIMQKAAQMLEKFGIEYEMTIISAHRMPDVFVDYATKAEERGIEVIIAGAGGGGFLQVILKKGVTRNQLKERMHEIFQDSGVDVWECELLV